MMAFKSKTIDPQWLEKDISVERTETPFHYVKRIGTDAHLEYERKVMVGLVDYMVMEGCNHSPLHNTKLLAEIKRFRKLQTR